MNRETPFASFSGFAMIRGKFTSNANPIENSLPESIIGGSK
jgi:hypothetical protein